MIKNLVIGIFIFIFPFVVFGQGSYEPPQADQTFPRTIIDFQDIPEVQNSLNDSLKFYLYTQIYNKAMSVIPDGNLTFIDRRNRAEIAREAAFVYLLNRKVESNQIFPLAETDSLLFLNKTIDILESTNDSVGFQSGWSFYWEWQLRSRELIHLLVAYDLLKGAGVDENLLVTAKMKLQNFTGNLFARTVDFYPNPLSSAIPLEFFSYNPNNHAIITSSTLGVAAIVLSDATSPDKNFQPISWINSAMWNLDNTLWNADGIIPRVSEKNELVGYAEGPNYFQYGFNNAMIFIRSMGNFLPDDSHDYTFRKYNAFTGASDTLTRSIQNPWYDENYQNLYEWMNLIRMPDGRFPAIHDSGRSFKSMITALSGNPSYNIPNAESNYNSIWIRSQFISTLVNDGEFESSLFQALPEAGSLIFRSSYNNPEGLYMHLIGKNGIALSGAKAHHQADATSFQIYFNEEDLALDPGYSGSVYRADVEKATDHNLILVNGKGPGTPNGEFINPNNITYIENHFDLPSIDYGELRSGWEDAEISRKTIFLRNEYFIMTDVIRSNNTNNYTFQLHGFGLEDESSQSSHGAFVSDFSNSQVTYSRNNSNLLANISSRGQSIYETVLDSLSLGSNGYQEYSKTLVHENETENTEFLSILFPYTNGTTPLIQDFPWAGDVNAKIISTDTYKDLVFVQPHNLTTEVPTIDFQFEENISGNGNINYISLDQSDNFQSLFIENGNLLKIGTKEFFKTDVNLDFSLEKEFGNEYVGYISQAATIEISTDSSMMVELGDISEISFDSISKTTTLTFENATYFKLKVEDISNSNKDIYSNTISIEIFPNPAQDFTNITIQNNKKQKDASLQIVDIHGKIISKKSLKLLKGNNSYALNLKDIPAGLYFIKIQSGLLQATKKLSVF